jgi:Uncharacterized protein conserved in bacteria
MENHIEICMNCFEQLPQGTATPCSVCGWNNRKLQIQEALKYRTILGEQYLIGRAKSMNGEGITYSAFDLHSRKVVEIREFFPSSIAERSKKSNMVEPLANFDVLYDELLDEFVELSKNVSRLREVSVIHSVTDILEENFTAYIVYEYVPSLSLRKYVEKNGPMSWNEANSTFMPVLTALGLLNSLGISHLGISPDSLRITADRNLLITNFSIREVRKKNNIIPIEICHASVAPEQYSAEAICGEISDVYSFAATFIFAFSGTLPAEARKRLRDERLMISREHLKDVPPHAVTALANALQVNLDLRTVSFEHLKTALSASPKLVTQLNATAAIRKLPSMNQNIPQNRGIPSFVWLILSCAVTLIALYFIASASLERAGMSFNDITDFFGTESSGIHLEVPNMLNESFEEWEEKIKNGEYSFELHVSSMEFSDAVAEGTIISQSPGGGENLGGEKVVTVVVSRGRAERKLPKIKSRTYKKLAKALEKDGFVVEREDIVNADVEVGVVVEYKNLSAGDTLPYGSTIILLVSAEAE